MTTRLSQYGVGVQAYQTPTNIELSASAWGWTAYPVTVEFKPAANSRLSQFGVGVKRYEPPSSGITVNLSKEDWGWTAYPIDIPDQNVYMDVDEWGWAPQNITVCSQSDKGYFGSFNANVWPSCTWNNHVFGPRTHQNIDLQEQSWGWQPYAVTVTFSDPQDVDLTRADWGWTELPVAVSYSYDVQMRVEAWGWQSFPITAELPYGVDMLSDDWGWTPIPVAVSFGTDINSTVGSWGWTPNPIQVDVPSTDVNMRTSNWGWEAFPIDVRQASLLPDDIELIANAVYQKLVDEGVIYKIDRIYRRFGCDPSYPQTFNTPENGHTIECGDIIIDQMTDPQGNVTQQRR